VTAAKNDTHDNSGKGHTSEKGCIFTKHGRKEGKKEDEKCLMLEV
jgi:hypothetical protein